MKLRLLPCVLVIGVMCKGESGFWDGWTGWGARQHAADPRGSRATGIPKTVGSKLQCRAAAVSAEVAAGAPHTQTVYSICFITNLHSSGLVLNKKLGEATVRADTRTQATHKFQIHHQARELSTSWSHSCTCQIIEG